MPKSKSRKTLIVTSFFFIIFLMILTSLLSEIKASKKIVSQNLIIDLYELDTQVNIQYLEVPGLLWKTEHLTLGFTNEDLSDNGKILSRRSFGNSTSPSINFEEDKFKFKVSPNNHDFSQYNIQVEHENLKVSGETLASETLRNHKINTDVIFITDLQVEFQNQKYEGRKSIYRQQTVSQKQQELSTPDIKSNISWGYSDGRVIYLDQSNSETNPTLDHAYFVDFKIANDGNPYSSLHTNYKYKETYRSMIWDSLESDSLDIIVQPDARVDGQFTHTYGQAYSENFNLKNFPVFVFLEN